MSPKVLILRNDADRSYTCDIVNIKKEDDDYIYFNQIKIEKSNIRSMENATYFKTKLKKRFGYRLIQISQNKRTGDKSFSHELVKAVAENSTHIQIAHSVPWGYEPVCIIKEEHEIMEKIKRIPNE